jgi:hypothetical protein
MKEKLTQLANVANDLPDKDLEEVTIFAAFLKYRRRVIDFAIRTSYRNEKPNGEYCTCSTAVIHDGVCINCALPYKSRSVNL